MDPVIVNAAESHHYDVEMTHPISWIVAAADAMSASRPGARFDTKEFFIEKMGELEKLIREVEGVEKVHIMQAGREIMVFVNPKMISDLQVEGLLQTVGKKIEEQLDYPGIIVFLVTTYYLCKKYNQDFIKLFNWLPWLIIPAYVLGLYVSAVLDGGSIIPSSLKFLSPYGYRFSMIGVLVAIVFSMVLFLRNFRRSETKKIWIDIFFFGFVNALTVLGIFLLL